MRGVHIRGNHIRVSHIRLSRIWLAHIWRGRIWPARIRVRRFLGLLVNNILRICDPPVGPAKLAADDVTRLFQFLDGVADGLHSLLADGGEAPGAVVPIVREGQEHGQQPFGFQRQGGILQMMVGHDGVIPRPLHTIDSHASLTSYSRFPRPYSS